MKRSRWVIALAAVSSLALAACGSTTSNAQSSSASTAGSASALPALNASVTSPPTSIGITQPLGKVPPKGKSVVWLQCAIPACARFNKGFQDATAALGWKLRIIVYQNSNPGAGLQQAINLKPDYIAIGGIPSAAMKPQIAEAKAAGIPIMSNSTLEQPPSSPFKIQTGGTLAPDAKLLAEWAVADAHGKANILAVTIPQFPVLNSETDWYKQSFKAMCPACSYGELDVSVPDLSSGAVPSKIVAYVQSHPDTNYVFLTFSDLATGVSQALRSAGLSDKVKLIGAAGDASLFSQIPATEAAWTTQANPWDAWVAVDAMARASLGEKLPPGYQKSVFVRPSWVVDAQSKKYLNASGGDWYGPTNFQSQFEKLWGVSSS